MNLLENNQKHISWSKGLTKETDARIKRVSDLKRKPKVSMLCKQCNTIFEVYPCRKNIAKYCSTKCCNQAKKDLTKENSLRWTPGVILTCKFCGVNFRRSSCFSHIQFCSWKCYIQARRFFTKYRGQNAAHFGIKHSIETRYKMSLSGGGTGITGELSNYGFEFTNKLKEKIRKRDNYECQLCGIAEKEYLIIRERVLDVHHIDYNKKNCKEDNLITLCNKCNLKVNYNRTYWQEYFKLKIKRSKK